jgi:hypothetical protein
MPLFFWKPLKENKNYDEKEITSLELEKSKRFWTWFILLPTLVATLWVLLGAFSLILADNPQTFSPDAGTGNTTVDGILDRRTVNENWTTIRTSTGNYVYPVDNVLMLEFETRTSSGIWATIGRNIITIDLSGFTGSIDDIVGITFNLFNLGISSQTIDTAISLTDSMPTANNNLINADYANLGSTRYSDDIPVGNISPNNWTTFTLNSAGIAAVKSAITNSPHILKLGLRYKNDLDNTENWSSGKNEYIYWKSADYGSDKPYLAIAMPTPTPTPEPIEKSWDITAEGIVQIPAEDMVQVCPTAQTIFQSGSWKGIYDTGTPQWGSEGYCGTNGENVKIDMEFETDGDGDYWYYFYHESDQIPYFWVQYHRQNGIWTTTGGDLYSHIYEPPVNACYYGGGLELLKSGTLKTLRFYNKGTSTPGTRTFKIYDGSWGLISGCETTKEITAEPGIVDVDFSGLNCYLNADYAESGYTDINIEVQSELIVDCSNGAWLQLTSSETLTAKIWGITPVSETEITDLNTNFNFGWQGLYDWDTITVLFQNRDTGIFTKGKDFLIDTIGTNGTMELNLQDFNFDKNGKYYFYAIATRTVPEVINGMFLTGKQSTEFSNDLVDPNYYLTINITGFTTIFEIPNFIDWYGLNAKFSEPTPLFSSIAGFFQPIFNKIGEFGNRIKDYFNVNESYTQGYEIGKAVPYFTYFVGQIDLFLGGFPIMKWLFVIILLLTGIFIFRLVMKFIPGLGN